MKKKLGLIALFCTLALACAAFIACEKGECLHKNMSTQSFAPTCEEKGYTLYSCDDCSYSFTADFVAPTGHSFSEQTVAPTCQSEGYTLLCCSVCAKEEKIEIVPPLEHDYKTMTIEPTCEGQGYTYLSCKICGHYESSDFKAPTGHALSAEVVAPTCENEGYTIYSCEDCTYSFRSDFVKPTGHDYSTEVVRPNIDRTGYTVYRCNDCESEHVADYVFYSDIFTGASGEGKGALAFGIDVSYHNKTLDWEAIAAAGVDFAIIRLGSSNGKDPMFEKNYAAAVAAGIDVGVYFYTYSLDAEGAKKDAELTLEWLDGKRLEYPVFFDVEDYAPQGYYPSELPEETLMDMCHTYMTALIDGGYYPGLYTNNNFLYSKYNEERVLRLYDVWYARYRYNNDYLDFEESYSETYSMWQYSDQGELSGVSGVFDFNFAFKDYPEIMKKYGYNGY